MAPSPLRQLLEELHAKLQQAQPVDTDERELLRDLQRDIQGLLARDEAGPAEHDPRLIARLNRAMQQFEVSHPYLTLGLAQLIDTLSRAGV